MLNGGTSPPNCNALSLASSCQATCSDSPPGLTSSCGSVGSPRTYTLRMCTANSDCSGDGSNTSCCSFNGSPLYWCAPGIDALVSGVKCM
jgi:hypothetical protein